MSQALRDLEHALAVVYGSDQSIEAGCVMDQLTDLGWALTPSPTRVETRGQQALPDPASTRGLPRKRSA